MKSHSCTADVRIWEEIKDLVTVKSHCANNCMILLNVRKVGLEVRSVGTSVRPRNNFLWSPMLVDHVNSEPSEL